MQENDYVLAIISDYPIEGYLRKGYDFVYSYYNPLGFFKAIYYFEPYAYHQFQRTLLYKILARLGVHLFFRKSVNKTVKSADRGYDFFIHRICDYSYLKKVFSSNKIDCIRIYEMHSFDLAKRLSIEFNIPLVVSVH